jgi:regulator of sigma E protease
MSFLDYIFGFLLVLGPIVLIHELGHFLVAKFFGVRVVVFSIGFGKRLWGFVRNGTDYRICALPLGGYVRMGGEIAEDASDDPAEFVNKPRWQRILIYLAGPAMNFAFSIGLVTVLFMLGISLMVFHEAAPVVGFIEAGSPAAQAGIVEGDRILAINERPMPLWKEVAFAVSTAKTAPEEPPLRFEIERGGERLNLLVKPVKHPEYGDGDIGIGPRLSLTFAEIVPGGAASTVDLRVDDVVRKVDGIPIGGIDDLIGVLKDKAGQRVEFDLLRDGEPVLVGVVPKLVDGRGQIGARFKLSRKLPLGEALIASLKVNADVVEKTARLMKMMVSREVAAKDTLSGPIGIAAYSGEAFRGGFEQILYMIAMLSVSIGIMNLLPIPILDGGQIAILGIESVLRRDLSLGVKERFAQVGFMLLVLLMSVALIFDLLRNVPKLFAE